MTHTRRLFSAGVIAALFASVATLTSPPVEADGCYGTHHYAGESVVLNGQGGFYHAPSCDGSPYYGWVGIDGQVTFPTSVPYTGTNQHNTSAGWIDITMQTGSFVQEGWFTGCALGHCHVGTIGWFTEWDNATLTPPVDVITDWGNAPLGGSSIFLIEYAGTDTAGNGCWNLYFDYSNLKEQDCLDRLSTSGQPVASSETNSVDGTAVQMPLIVYGYSNPNTNNALRIKGANGFVPWTGTLSTGETAYYDERYGEPGCGHNGNPPCAYYWFSVTYYNYDVYDVSS